MANHIELRKVIVLQQSPNGGQTTQTETWEYRTKDVLISILGVSLGTWSPWTPIEAVTIYEDENGNPL